MSVQTIQQSPFISFQPQMMNNTSNVKFKTVPYAPDTVEISGKKSNTKKVAVGIGAILLATVGTILGIKAYKASSIKQAQKTFQEVFMRDDITKEQAAQMLQRYKDIGKIQDKEEYIKALFDEAKKNFGFGDGCMKLRLPDPKFMSELNTAGEAHFLRHVLDINKDCSRRKLLDTIHHEMRHKKQAYLMLNQCGTIEEFVSKLPPFPKCTKKEFLQVLQESPELFKYLEQFGIKELNKANVPPKYKDYVEKLLKDLPNYKEAEFINGKVNKEYYDNFLEVDARKSGGAMESLLSKFIR